MVWPFHGVSLSDRVHLPLSLQPWRPEATVSTLVSLLQGFSASLQKCPRTEMHHIRPTLSCWYLKMVLWSRSEIDPIDPLPDLSHWFIRTGESTNNHLVLGVITHITSQASAWWRKTCLLHRRWIHRSKSGKKRWKLQQGVETPSHPTLSPPKTRPSTARVCGESNQLHRHGQVFHRWSRHGLVDPGSPALAPEVLMPALQQLSNRQIQFSAKIPWGDLNDMETPSEPLSTVIVFSKLLGGAPIANLVLYITYEDRNKSVQGKEEDWKRTWTGKGKGKEEERKRTWKGTEEERKMKVRRLEEERKRGKEKRKGQEERKRGKEEKKGREEERKTKKTGRKKKKETTGRKERSSVSDSGRGKERRKGSRLSVVWGQGLLLNT